MDSLFPKWQHVTTVGAEVGSRHRYQVPLMGSGISLRLQGKEGEEEEEDNCQNEKKKKDKSRA